MSVIESILQDLRELPAPQLVEVARYVHRLNPKNAEARRKALRETAGCMNATEGENFEKAVRSEAERIDEADWQKHSSGH